MLNSADTDQLASSEANWSGSALFTKVEYNRVQQDQGLQLFKGWFYIIFFLRGWEVIYFLHIMPQCTKVSDSDILQKPSLKASSTQVYGFEFWLNMLFFLFLCVSGQNLLS